MSNNCCEVYNKPGKIHIIPLTILIIMIILEIILRTHLATSTKSYKLMRTYIIEEGNLTHNSDYYNNPFSNNYYFKNLTSDDIYTEKYEKECKKAFLNKFEFIPNECCEIYKYCKNINNKEKYKNESLRLLISTSTDDGGTSVKLEIFYQRLKPIEKLFIYFSFSFSILNLIFIIFFIIVECKKKYAKKDEKYYILCNGFYLIMIITNIIIEFDMIILFLFEIISLKIYPGLRKYYERVTENACKSNKYCKNAKIQSSIDLVMCIITGIYIYFISRIFKLYDQNKLPGQNIKKKNSNDENIDITHDNKNNNNHINNINRNNYNNNNDNNNNNNFIKIYNNNPIHSENYNLNEINSENNMFNRKNGSSIQEIECINIRNN